MKVAKKLGFVAGGIVLLVVLAGAIALIPGVQTWAVRKAVADQPGMKIEVARVSAGFSSADIQDLRIVKDGIVITAKGVKASYSAWDYLTRKKINADSVTVEDLTVDLRAATTPASPGTPPPGGATKASANNKAATQPAAKSPPATFSGVLAQAQLPFDVRVARLAVKGRALLPQERTATFDVQGADIETGKRGKIDLKADFADPQKGAALSALHFTGTVGLVLSSDRRVTLLEIDATTAAEGPKLPGDRVKLEAKAEQLAAGGDEDFHATVALLRNQKVEPLLKAAAQYRVAAREFSGAWDLAVRSEQLAAVLAGLGLPELAATGGGKFSFKPDTGAIAASGDIQGSAQKLESYIPELARIGGIQFRAAFDGGLADNVARLERVQLDVTANDGRRIAQVTTTQRIGFSLADQRVSLADPKAELARITVQALPLAWAQPYLKGMTIDSGDLSLALAVEAEPDGSRVRARPLQPVTLRAVTIRQDQKKLVEQLTLTANPRIDYSSERVIAEIADLNVSLPAGDAVTGTLGATVTNLKTTPAIAFTSQIRAKIVAAHKAFVTVPVETGPLAIESTTQGKFEGDVLQIAKASTTVTREGGAVMVALEVQQPVTVNTKASTFTVPNPNATLARVRLGEVPLAWAEPFVAKSKFAGSVASGTLDVTARSADDLGVNTVEPVVLRGVSVALDGKALVQALDLTANLTASKKGDVIRYEVRRVEVKQGNVPLAGLTVAGELKLGPKLIASAKGNLEADAAALMNQPAAAAFATLARGRVTSDFDANLGETIQAKAKLSARGLVAKKNNQPLGDLEVTLDASMKADGSGTVTAPITMTNGARKSDIAVDGTFGKSTDQKTFLFTGKISSNQIFVDDFQPLAAVAPGEQPAVEQRGPNTTVVRAPGSTAPRPGTTAPAPTSTGPAARDTKPFWDGVQGKVAVDLKRIVYGKDYDISGVHGTAVITGTKLSLDGLEGRMKETPFKLNGGLTFDAQKPKPYALAGGTDVRDFDVGAFLRAANPNEPPALETKATVLANLNGNGGNIGDLIKNVYGKVEITTGKGVTPIFGRKEGLGKAVQLASLAGQLLGKDEKTVAISRLATLLDRVPFDSFKMQIERGSDLQMKITSLEMISPILRAVGNGTVANQPNTEVTRQPMDIVLQLGAKDEFALLLSKLTKLGEADTTGYHLLQRNFKIGGTAGKPDSNALWKYLLELGAEQAGLPGGLGELLQRGLGR